MHRQLFVALIPFPSPFGKEPTKLHGDIDSGLEGAVGGVDGVGVPDFDLDVAVGDGAVAFFGG